MRETWSEMSQMTLTGFEATLIETLWCPTQSLLLIPACNRMVLDGIITSPHRRSQTAFSSSSVKKQYSKEDELGSFSTVVRRHRYLLTALVLLAILCTVYLYFAVTLGDVCSGLTPTQKALCRVQIAKESIAKRKLKL
ncbi:hypothetical protein M8C21_011526 [Ambrosia artemisiifolia]|uniref:Uncharacterized protein n=1 Tax=Ambrosia artemisiifolia TaxID=4212 RepID=A0AAD5BXW9_AMBAR|nr:hypothetical protein M8C21_011526 [Ambrosia artemisiifolia]